MAPLGDWQVDGKQCDGNRHHGVGKKDQSIYRPLFEVDLALGHNSSSTQRPRTEGTGKLGRVGATTLRDLARRCSQKPVGTKLDEGHCFPHSALPASAWLQIETGMFRASFSVATDRERTPTLPVASLTQNGPLSDCPHISVDHPVRGSLRTPGPWDTAALSG